MRYPVRVGLGVDEEIWRTGVEVKGKGGNSEEGGRKYQRKTIQEEKGVQ